MKRIVFVDEDARCAGATVSLLYIVRRFVRDGYDVTVCTQKTGEYLDVYRGLGVHVVPIGIRGFSNLCLDLYATSPGSVLSAKGFSTMAKDAVKFAVSLVYFVRLFRRLRPDFVYVNEYVLPQAIAAAALLRIPTGVHIRSSMLRGTMGVRRWLVGKLVARTASVIVPITPAEGSQIPAGRRDRHKIHVVGEFLDDRNFAAPESAAACRATWGMDPSLKYVVMLGGLSAIKGTMEFLRAARTVLERRDDIRFIIAGKAIEHEPEYCRACEELLLTPVLKKGVVFLGEVADVPALIACADLLVSSNISSHFSRPVIEAWALRKPVVSSATAHARSLIDDGVDGILADVADAEAFGRAMERAAADPELAAALAENGHRKAVAKFRADENTRVIEELVAASMHHRQRGQA